MPRGSAEVAARGRSQLAAERRHDGGIGGGLLPETRGNRIRRDRVRQDEREQGDADEHREQQEEPARDEEPEPTTQESMFNFVRLSDGQMPRLSDPRAETDIIAELARRVLGDGSVDWGRLGSHCEVRQWIAKVIPGYEAIGEIDRTKREFHITGRIFHEPRFATPTGRA